MPKVSVIIPNYNHAKYLQQRIDSVLHQTYTDFEVIILDDCSTDNSKEVIEQYRSNEKITSIIYNEVNSGSPFKQWDKGINLAQGKYIWIAESDDWCENSLLENLVEGLEKNEECILAYCQGYCVLDDGRIKFQSSHTKLAEYIDGKHFITHYILPRNPIFNAGMAVWRKEAYDKISNDYLNYKLIGDYCFWIELSTKGSVFICGKILNYFRAHEKNLSATAFKNGLTFTEQLPLLKSFLDNKTIDKKDYLKALKKSYWLFRFSEKDISKENAVAVRKLFAMYSNAKYRLELYCFQKYLQSVSKKLLRL